MRSSTIKRNGARVAVFIALCAAGLPSLHAQASGGPRILVINSYHEGYAWTDSVMLGVYQALKDASPKIELEVEYMDSMRYPSEEDRKRFTELLTGKTKGREYRAIITTDNDALALALGLRPTLFPNAGIVFCGLNGNPADIVGKAGNVTGVCEKWDPAGTLKAIARMQRSVKRIAVLHDDTENGLETFKEFQEAAGSFSDRFSFDVIPSQPVGETLATLESLKSGTAVLLLGYNRDGAGVSFDSSDTGPMFASHSKVPVYAVDETRFLGGVIGGSLLSGEVQGSTAAGMAITILRGTQADRIPIVDSPAPKLIFDHAVMSRFKIPESSVPPDALISNWPESIFWHYRYPLVIVSCVVFFLIMLTVILTMNVIIRRRVEDERARLVVILEATTDVVCTSTMDLRLQYMNGSGRQLLGWTSIHGKSMAELHSQAAFKKLKTDALPTIERSGRWIGETTIRTSDGRTIPVSQVLMLHTAPKGNKRYISTIMRDISGRMQSEEALRAGEESLGITLDAIGDAVIATDARGLVTRMNPAAEGLTLWLSSEAVGKPYADIVSMTDEDGERVEADPVDAAPRAGKAAPRPGARRIIMRKDGSRRTVSDSSAPIRDKAGVVIGAVIVLRDVSDDAELQERQRLSQRMEVIGQLAGGIAHDFNNILTAILGSAQLINMNLLAGSEEQLLSDEIIKATMRATELTKQLISFSHRTPMRMEPVCIHPIIEEVVQLLSRSMDKLITVRPELNAQSDLILGDPSLLHSAILNLGMNARDAMPSGGEIAISTRTVKLDVDECVALCIAPSPGDYIEITVTDSGSGMSPEVRDRLFEPYFTTKSSAKGTGLGLASVYGCVQSHKGQIKVESAEGAGSSFIMYLPLYDGDQKKETQRDPGAARAGHGHILLIDDEESIRKTTAAILKAAGYSVSLAADGNSGIALFRERGAEIDLVLLDLIMPGMSGREVFYLLKGIKPDVKVFLYSGYAQHQVTEELIQNGALGLLNKPFRMEELMRKFSGALKG